MNTEIVLNNTSIFAHHYEHKMIRDKHGNPLHQIKLHFHVTSSEYHRITTLLYENSFHVRVPSEKLQFQAVISNYITSFTNLYEENQVGEFTLELVETFLE